MQYEGLVKETASQIVAVGVQLEFDDVAQLLRMKAWKAVNAFDAERAAKSKHLSRDRHGRSAQDRFVFMCLLNMRKQIEALARRYNVSIDELRETAGDTFDGRYLSVDHEQVFGEVEESDLPLPSTLTEIERQVVQLRLRGRLLLEIDRELSLSRAQRQRLMESIRLKCADWAPSAPQPRSAPMRPLPAVGTPATRPRLARAA